MSRISLTGSLRIGEKNPAMQRWRPDSLTGRARTAFEQGWQGNRHALAELLNCTFNQAHKILSNLQNAREIITISRDRHGSVYGIRPAKPTP